MPLIKKSFSKIRPKKLDIKFCDTSSKSTDSEGAEPQAPSPALEILSRPDPIPNLASPSRFQTAKNIVKKFLEVLSIKEKIIFGSLFLIFLISAGFISANLIFGNGKTVPAKGGTYTEAVLGQPRFINPVYANSDIDRDLTQLVFSGLMKYDENMNVVPDLAEKYEISENNTVYKFTLKKNVLWQDNEKLNADDIVFTIKTIQNPDFKSPYRPNWIGVEVEKIDDYSLKFTLKKPYNAFLENCTLKIIPKHSWEGISLENFPFSDLNLKPVGSGPYKIEEVKQGQPEGISYITLSQNPLYFDKKPNISEIKFEFFDKEEDMVKTARAGKINGLSVSSPLNLGEKWNQNSMTMPRFFAVFFNQDQNKILADKNVRLALNYATDKKEIAQKIFGLTDGNEIQNGITDSPILPKLYGVKDPQKIYSFDLAKAQSLLSDAGFTNKNENGFLEKTDNKEIAFKFEKDLKLGSSGKDVEELQKCLIKIPDVFPSGQVTGKYDQNTANAVSKFQEKYAKDILDPWGFKQGTGMISKTTRTKLNEVCFAAPAEKIELKISLDTVDQPQLKSLAELLKSQWGKIGVEVDINTMPLFQLEQDFIKPRSYDALLLGEVLGAIPDPFPFWHSSQIKDPGLNLALYQSAAADKILEDIRNSSDQKDQQEKLSLLQDIIINDAPAVFLLNPNYIYLSSRDVKGIETQKIADPSKRFVGIENWYMKTRKIW